MADGRIRDPKMLRALAHPFRWKLIDLITTEGSCTATRCSEVLGESVASCSYHLNMLAKYGFVEEVPGPGRQKPWRLARPDQNFSADGLDDEGVMAAEAAADAFLEQEFDKTKQRIRQIAQEPDEWRRSLGLDSTITWLTAGELLEAKSAIREIYERFAERRENMESRPEGARPVRFFLSTTVAPQK